MKIRVNQNGSLKVVNTQCASTEDENLTHYKGKWAYDYYPDKDNYPATYTKTVKEIDFWIIESETGYVTINGNLYANGTTIQALENVPAQNDNNWKRF